MRCTIKICINKKNKYIYIYILYIELKVCMVLIKTRTNECCIKNLHNNRQENIIYNKLDYN